MINSNINRIDWIDQRKWEVKQKFYWDLLTTLSKLGIELGLTGNYLTVYNQAISSGDQISATTWRDLQQKSFQNSQALNEKLKELIAVAGVIIY